MRVVADTGPLNYLILIDQIDLLPRLFGGVIIPRAVRFELDQPATPTVVRSWIANPPPWLSISPRPPGDENAGLARLDDGERAAVILAGSLGADLILMDDRDGVSAARDLGFAVTGTLGLLDRAARRGMVDLDAAFLALRTTSFRVRRALLDSIAAEWRGGRGAS